MHAVVDRYEGRLFMRRATGAGPYLGSYGLVGEAGSAQDVSWVGLQKWWPTEREANDDAAGAARFAITSHLFRTAAARAAQASAYTLTLADDAATRQSAVRAQYNATIERDAWEARLIGAREGHWPSPRDQQCNEAVVRCR